MLRYERRNLGPLYRWVETLSVRTRIRQSVAGRAPMLTIITTQPHLLMRRLRYRVLFSLTIALLFFVLAVGAHAQSTGIVEGRVVDADGGAPLPGANVVVEGQAASFRAATSRSTWPTPGTTTLGTAASRWLTSRPLACRPCRSGTASCPLPTLRRLRMRSSRTSAILRPRGPSASQGRATNATAAPATPPTRSLGPTI